MKVWTCRDFKGRFPVGTAAVVVARTGAAAARLLEAELARIGLSQRIHMGQLTELKIDFEKVVILDDGDY